ncbi:MAG: hypothetical protein ABH821_02015 [archaeon]
MKFKLFLVLMIVIFLMPFSSAISSFEAQNLASSYALTKEIVEIYPLTTVSFGGESYWVVSILSNNNLALMVPLNKETGVMPSKNLTKESLMQSQFVLRSIQFLSDSSSKRFVSNKMKSDLDSLANTLTSTQTRLISGLLKDESLGSEVLDSGTATVKELSNLIDLVESISGKLEKTIKTENDFLFEPRFEDLTSLKKSYQELFLEVKSLSNASVDYRRESDELVSLLLQPELDIDESTRIVYLDYAEVPYNETDVSSIISLAGEEESIINQIFSESLATADFSNNLDSRIKRLQAFNDLYSFDSAFNSKTGYDSLDQAVHEILHENNINNWLDQDTVRLLRTNWSQAERYFESGSFESASEYAVSAKANVITIKNAGISLQPVTPEPLPVSQEQGIMLVVGLIVFLIIITIVRKTFIKGKQEPVQEKDVENPFN